MFIYKNLNYYFNNKLINIKLYIKLYIKIYINILNN